jgi:hypothetical protein
MNVQKACRSFVSLLSLFAVIVAASDRGKANQLMADGSGPVPRPPAMLLADGSGPVPRPPAMLLADGSGPVPRPPAMLQFLAA